MDWEGSKLLALNPLRIPNNQRTIVVNFHHDLVGCMHSDFFHGQTDRGLIY
jgi:hypothetical protein